MTKIVDLFGHNTRAEQQPNWKSVVESRFCPFVAKACYKTRKSNSDIAIGTCTVEHSGKAVIICPLRLLERRQIFTDCLHLLTGHEPGNELHLVPEIGIPGGNIDYFFSSVRDGKVRDFVGIELQTLDSTGTVWPERQRFLAKHGIEVDKKDTENKKTFGMNWKMTAKTILVQLHHKIQTFEQLNKHLVLVTQDHLLSYMGEAFSFDHLVDARTADPMHFHAYELVVSEKGAKLNLIKRLSTDTNGIAECLGLQGEAKVELDVITSLIEAKLSDQTLYKFDAAPEPIAVNPEK